jgi:hypothetical protein
MCMVVKEAVLAGPVSELHQLIDCLLGQVHGSYCFRTVCSFFDLLALSAKWRMSIWKLVNFHSSLDFVESFVFLQCNKNDQQGSLCMQ